MNATLHDLVQTSESVRRASGRLEKRDHMVDFFSDLEPEDLGLASSYLAGEIPQGALRVGWSALRQASSMRGHAGLPLFADDSVAEKPAPFSLADLNAALDELAQVGGAGASRRRARLLAGLMRRSSAQEQQFLFRLFLGELRQGALRALVVEALAKTLEIPLDSLRRAIMFSGSFATVVRSVARDGARALGRFRIRPLVPVEPMLAAHAASLADAITDFAQAAVEWKLDGVRVQVHRQGHAVRIFSRQRRDITSQLPELQNFGRGLPVESFVLDGEVIAYGEDSRPIPFQDLMSRLAGEGPALLGLFFDCLYLDGKSLVDEPYTARRAALESFVPESNRVPQRVVENEPDAREMLDQALARGHEGILIKKLDALYFAGRRGSEWRKVKPAWTLDLVILAAEWGHGRRQGFLSNLHLGARDPEKEGRFVMLGKTFKGLTDEMLRQMTNDLLSLEVRREKHVVHVRPERVVEIAFDTVQRSPRYDSGLALRFARVKRFRHDKSAAEATTIDEVRDLRASRTT